VLDVDEGDVRGVETDSAAERLLREDGGGQQREFVPTVPHGVLEVAGRVQRLDRERRSLAVGLVDDPRRRRLRVAVVL